MYVILRVIGTRFTLPRQTPQWGYWPAPVSTLKYVYYWFNINTTNVSVLKPLEHFQTLITHTMISTTWEKLSLFSYPSSLYFTPWFEITWPFKCLVQREGGWVTIQLFDDRRVSRNWVIRPVLPLDHHVMCRWDGVGAILYRFIVRRVFFT